MYSFLVFIEKLCNFDHLYSNDEIVSISKYKFILTILNILFLYEYQIPRYIGITFLLFMLEVYHSLLNKWTDKSTHFSYKGIVSRCKLAAIDFNQGKTLEQAKTMMEMILIMFVFQRLQKPGRLSL